MAFEICHLIICMIFLWKVSSETQEADENLPNFTGYCVIGAGPAGLQMAYYFKQAGHDYVVYERNHRAGMFFDKYPIHRKLNSISKKYTGRTNKEFNLRHDWNSLISHDDSLRVTKYAKGLYPEADVLVKYLNDFATKLDLNVRYNTNISDIFKDENSIFRMKDQHGNAYTCKYAIIATGLGKPNHLSLKGWEHVEGYEDVIADPTHYEGLSTLVLGGGNSALEVGNIISTSTASVHVMSASNIESSWETHYPADIRAPVTGIQDTYLLKSLDGIFVGGELNAWPIAKSPLDGKLYMRDRDDYDNEPGGAVIEFKDNSETREGYDKIIRCLGFLFDDSIFHSNVTIRRARLARQEKYPRINLVYESLDLRKMYFVGTPTHALDHKKSAGGFISGFRHTSKSLFHLLEWKNHEIKWPSIHFSNLVDLVPHILKRSSEAADLYDMFGVLCDVIIYNDARTEADYLHAVPCGLASKIPSTTGHEVPGALTLIALQYTPTEEPGSFERETLPAHNAHMADDIHPVLYHYETQMSAADYVKKDAKWVLPVPDRIHHVVEDITGVYNGMKAHHLPLRRFIEQTTGHDIRDFYGDQCLSLGLTTTTLPMGCRQDASNHDQQWVVANQNLAQSLVHMDRHLLPFQAIY